MLKIYTYKKCSTCRKATQWLAEKGISFEERAIRETPPTRDELTAMLDTYQGNLKRLFNTSGMDYRAAGLSSKLDAMSLDEAFELLMGNGNLVKRPFLIDEERGIFLVGYKEGDWAKAYANVA